MNNVNHLLESADFCPHLFIELSYHVPALDYFYSMWVTGSITWDDMLVSCYQQVKMQCENFAFCYPGIKLMPEFTSPLDLTDQKLIIACIVGCLSFLDREVKPMMKNNQEHN